MRNTITLNGNSSDDIKGLLIQSLPAIHKPMIRTTIEEIDGRDGDIITKLGYGAYDKQISIGLYGDFNIDEVIQFFDSEGEVIFSNEPDKYYKYQITERIDFERLIRFRTATVYLHVQPFKYSTDEFARNIPTTDKTEVSIQNNGNIYSKPKLTLEGTGTVNLNLNGVQIFVINFGDNSNYLTIDTELMEAYQGSTDVLMNRSVDGDYQNAYFKTGRNVITWSGTLSSIGIENYSRWI